MNRRTLLQGMGIASVNSISGCLSEGEEDLNGHRLENEPESLIEQGECEYPVASLELYEPVNESQPNSSMVDYSELHELSKILFDFYVSRGSAIACEDTEHFDRLFRDLRDIGEYPYPSDSDSRYSRIYIRSNLGLFELDELILHDQVLD